MRELHKMLGNKKQEEAALLNDMEITGQAFEDMQVIMAAIEVFLFLVAENLHPIFLFSTFAYLDLSYRA